MPPSTNNDKTKMRLSQIGLFRLRQISRLILEIIQDPTKDVSEWLEPIRNLFDGYQTVVDGIDLIDGECTIQDGIDDYFTYHGLLNELNTQSVETFEDVEYRIMKMADYLDILTGDVVIEMEDSHEGDFNYPN